MRSLSEQIEAETTVKNYFKEQWNDEKHWVYCQCVQDACLGMIEGTEYDEIVFILSAWLHDMGKVKDKANHHEESLANVAEFLMLHPKYNEHRDLVMECVLNHRTTGKPDTDEAKIFQLADKVALKNLKWINYKREKSTTK